MSGSVQGEIVITAFCAAAVVLQITFLGWDATTPIALALLILALIMVYAIPITYDAWHSYRGMTGQERRRLLRHFLPSALPLIVIVFAMVCVEERIRQWLLDETLYAFEADGIHSNNEYMGCQNAAVEIRLVCRKADQSTEKDVDDTIKRIKGATEARLQARLKPALEGLQDEGTASANTVRDVLWEGENAVIPKNIGALGLQYKTGISCSTWSLIKGGSTRRKDCAERWMLEPVDGMIQKARRAALDEFNANVKALEEQGKSYSGSVEAELENYINGPLKNVFVEARKSNARLFLVWRWSGWLALAVQVFILLKALALIYARLAFNPQVGNQDLAAHIGGGNPGTAITTVERLTTVQEEKTGIHHGFRLPTPKVLYLFHCRGLVRSRQGALALPFGAKVLLGRFWHRKLLAYRYDPGEGREYGIYGDANATVLMVHLPPGAQIVLRLNHLLGFTHGLDLGTRYEINLANVMRGRMIFPVLSAGEAGGTVLLYAADGTFGKMTPEGDTAPSEALVAFDPSAKMQVDADTGWASAYVGEYAIRPADEQSFALYAAAAIPSPAWLLIRRFFYLVLPLPL